MNLFFNLTSIIFGLGAWIAPFIALFKRNSSENAMMFASFILCIGALCLQLLQAEYLIRTDFAAADDTIGFTAAAAVILSIVTITLNIWVQIKKNKNK